MTAAHHHVDDSWQALAACRGGEQAPAFYPPIQAERKDERVAREAWAKSICASCPVRRPCLEHALATAEPHGIWGGLTEQERRELSDRGAQRR